MGIEREILDAKTDAKRASGGLDHIHDFTVRQRNAFHVVHFNHSGADIEEITLCVITNNNINI